MQDAVRVKGNKKSGGCFDELWNRHPNGFDRGGSQGNCQGSWTCAVITTIAAVCGLWANFDHFTFAVTIRFAHRRGGSLRVHWAMIRTG